MTHADLRSALISEAARLARHEYLPEGAPDACGDAMGDAACRLRDLADAVGAQAQPPGVCSSCARCPRSPADCAAYSASHEPCAEWMAQAQPAPSGGTGDVWAELIEQLPPGRLRDACEARRALGIQRYGQPLRRGDGRDHRRDLAEELLDAAVYARALGSEGTARRLLKMGDLALAAEENGWVMP